MVEEAHVSVRATRQRLGLAPIGASAVIGEGDRVTNMLATYDDMTGLTAYILGIAKGLMYNEASSNNTCFNAVESGLTASSNLFWVLSKVYQPWYIAEGQLILQDNIALMSGFYKDCDVNKFMDSMTTLFSEEGASALAARGSVSYLTEYNRYKKVTSDEYATTFAKGRAFGKLFSAVTNYTI